MMNPHSKRTTTVCMRKVVIAMFLSRCFLVHIVALLSLLVLMMAAAMDNTTVVQFLNVVDMMVVLKTLLRPELI